MKHAVVVRESGEAGPINEGGSHVVSNVLPRLRETPGFVSAVWMTDGSGHTLNVLVFDTEGSALAALEPARNAPRPPFMQVDSADVYRVLADS